MNYMHDIQLHSDFLGLSGGKRYGFNGMEKDDELSGSGGGNSYDFGARMLSTRLGRWFKVDPLVQGYPMLSAFQFAGNNPIFLIDPDGKKIIPTGDGSTSSAQVSKEILYTYFSTAFGSPMADVLMESHQGNGLGDFTKSGSQMSRESFAKRFESAMGNIQDQYVRSMAIGVYETIMSDEIVSFVGFADNRGAGSGSASSRRHIDGIGKFKMNAFESYHSREPMVLGTPGLCRLENYVDVLYDPDGPGNPGNRKLSSGLVAASDGMISNSGSLTNPSLSMRRDVSGGEYARMAADVLSQIISTQRALNSNSGGLTENDAVEHEGEPTGYFDRQQDMRKFQSYFGSIANQATTNIAAQSRGLPSPQPIMTSGDRKSIESNHRPGRTDFKPSDGQ